MQKTIAVLTLVLLFGAASAAPQQNPPPTIVACGSSGSWVTVPAGTPGIIGTYPTHAEAVAASQDSELVAAAIGQLAADAAASQHCDLCPPPDTDHCARSVARDGSAGVTGVRDNGDGTYTAAVILVEDMKARAVCATCTGGF